MRDLDSRMLRRIRQSVLPVHGQRGLIGTGTVIGDGVALTALHVVSAEPLDTLGFGHHDSGRGLPVRATATLPLHRYGAEEELARRSHSRARQLTGSDDGTVDLALLAVPGLRAPTIPIRATPVHPREQVVVPGYPGGRWSITRGPITGRDEADFTALLLVGPGASGSPAIDLAGRLAGVVTLDNEAGTICIGPALLAAFINHTRQLLRQFSNSAVVTVPGDTLAGLASLTRLTEHQLRELNPWITDPNRLPAGAVLRVRA